MCACRSNALPPLDWPLPSQFDQYELRIEVQPRPHHRAHYETEGSRGAVKAAPTGHPVVKVGQADMQKSSLPVSFIKMILDFVQVKRCCWPAHDDDVSFFAVVWIHREEAPLSPGLCWNG